MRGGKLTIKKKIRGSAGLISLLTVSFVSLLLAGWGATIEAPSRMNRMYSYDDNLGYRAYSAKPKERWWGKKDDRFSRHYSTFGRRELKPITLDLPNVGLKDPADIEWPYGNEFEYEINGANLLYPGLEKSRYSFLYKYDRSPDGGVITETATMEMFSDLITTTETKIEFDGEGKSETVDTLMRMSMIGQSSFVADAMEFRTSLESKGKTAEYILYPLVWEDYDTEIPRRIVFTEDAPPDGYFYISTTSSPGYIAFLLSRVDWENYNRPKVWAPEFIGELPYSFGLESFIRLTIARLEKCPRHLRKWWEESRADFDGWEPGEGTSTVVIDFKRLDAGEEEEVCYSWG
jgi:hypothetical protein